jgi:hypothetical protein
VTLSGGRRGGARWELAVGSLAELADQLAVLASATSVGDVSSEPHSPLTGLPQHGGLGLQ